MKRTVAIHQPNFFPWLGYFDKIMRSDVFILLDDAQYQKTGGSWANRVKLLINGDGQWVTAPVKRNFHGTRKINEMVFSDKYDWRGKILKTIVTEYKRAYYFDEAFSIIQPLVMNPEANVAEYNIYAIKTLATQIGCPCRLFFRSSDFSTDLTATERLIELTKHVGGSHYLCGGGAAGYQDDKAFQKSGINLVYQNFLHPTYPQVVLKDFLAGLSVLDALMNVGIDRARQMMHQDNA